MIVLKLQIPGKVTCYYTFVKSTGMNLVLFSTFTNLSLCIPYRYQYFFSDKIYL